MADNNNINNNNNNNSSSSTSNNNNNNNNNTNSSSLPSLPPTNNDCHVITPNPNVGPTMGYPPAYGQPYYPYPPVHLAAAPERSSSLRGSSFIRGFLVMLLILIVLTFAASFATWLILRPEVPVFKVEKLAVTGLNNHAGPLIPFSAQFEARLLAENPNKKLRVYLEQVQGYVYHKEDFLASAALVPTFLPTQGKEPLAVRMSSGGEESQRPVGKWVSDEIEKEKSSSRDRSVGFNVRLLVSATFKSGQWWKKHASMKVFCEDLRVSFANNSSNNNNQSSGVFEAGDKHKRCVVYYA